MNWLSMTDEAYITNAFGTKIIHYKVYRTQRFYVKGALLDCQKQMKNVKNHMSQLQNTKYRP